MRERKTRVRSAGTRIAGIRCAAGSVGPSATERAVTSAQHQARAASGRARSLIQRNRPPAARPRRIALKRPRKIGACTAAPTRLPPSTSLMPFAW